VQAPPWQAVSRVRVYDALTVVYEQALDQNDTAPVRFAQDVTLQPNRDTAYVVRVDCIGSGDPVIEHAMPAFTNPLFVAIEVL
jgi:hypothetical protein